MLIIFIIHFINCYGTEKLQQRFNIVQYIQTDRKERDNLQYLNYPVKIFPIRVRSVWTHLKTIQYEHVLKTFTLWLDTDQDSFCSFGVM